MSNPEDLPQGYVEEGYDWKEIGQTKTLVPRIKQRCECWLEDEELHNENHLIDAITGRVVFCCLTIGAIKENQKIYVEAIHKDGTPALLRTRQVIGGSDREDHGWLHVKNWKNDGYDSWQIGYRCKNPHYIKATIDDYIEK